MSYPSASRAGVDARRLGVGRTRHPAVWGRFACLSFADKARKMGS